MNEKKEKDQWETVCCEKTARPEWITDELLIETRKVWQKYYEKMLSESELIEIIVGVSRLFC